ncbi:hypothetical protein DMH12_21040 [Streptomyces sp. WAC 04229]|uniref:hypothetical protein n=1 Tax=Streptomyces sp. WAC 04229 TaxID=2203206 RepID=UPI000F7393C7|nr:hypothetical protein [Streptomyces sp. WAC 04229]RSN51821.1 hypothetical protein DMH12_21040 [Streptomyces sp. WAC 04229]
MNNRKLLAEATGYVDLPPAQVRRALVAKFSDGYVAVDESDTHVGAQGSWWARREYALQPERRGTRVTLRVYNIASKARWAVPLVSKFFIGFPHAMQTELDTLLTGMPAPARH